MSKEKLQNIINDFNPEDFIHFFREKNRNFKPRTEELRNYDDNDFYNSTKLGEIDFSGNAKLIVCALQTDKPLSERSGKKSQYEKGKKILKDTQSDSGIFIFYDKNGNFRFSLIYANYLGKKRDWSTFKRFTYFVSKGFTNKTFLQRIGDGDFSSMDGIKEAFSVEKVTKEFYRDIAYWYFWAVKEVKFPKDAEEEDNGRNMSVIRMITRIIFIWFMKERGLIKPDLFSYEKLSKLLKNISKKETTYYKAILQNLFFATLNTKIKERKFRFNIKGWKNISYMDHTVYRYEDYFNDKNDMLELFKDIPFLNGGLFDCLDKIVDENGKKMEFRIDGFSDKDKGLKVPNCLFFADETSVDLNSDYGTKGKKYTAKGLINILSSYNFVIDENDPNDAEVALDPELLGKVFENLLASFNPETSSTARKATGSYYTPREIVDYMVTQSLKEYYKTNFDDTDEIENKLDILFSTNNQTNPFDKAQTKKAVELTDKLRIVDPAVGSGAFPMGILNKLVFILSKLDKGNVFWKNQQLKAVEENISDPVIRQSLKSNIEEQFADKNPDYGRKLYLIEKCIYGVDIQQIAVEIAKLRFFISLLVDENIDKTKDNWGIKPLPNLDYKIMQGNSLLEEYKGIKLIDKKVLESSKDDKLNIRDELRSRQSELQRKYFELDSKKELSKARKIMIKEEVNKISEQIKNLYKPENQMKGDDLFDSAKKSKNLFEQIKLKREEFFIESDRQKKDKLKKEIEGIEWEFIETSLNEQNKESEIDEIRKIIRSNKKPYFLWNFNFGEVFNEKGGFDVIIGNPPYINVENLDDITKEYLFSKYKTCSGRTDIYIGFIEVTMKLLKSNGCFSYIIPYPYTNQKYGALSRSMLLEKYFVREIVDASEYFIFENASVKNIILNVIKSKNQNISTIKFARSENDFYNNSFTVYKINQDLFLELKDYRFETKNIFGALKIKSKIWVDSVRLDQICLIAYGARLNHKTKSIGKDYYIHQNFKKNLKPFTEGKNIERYKYSQFGWLNYIPDDHYNPMFTELFENDKLFFINVVKDRLRFALDTNKLYNSHTVINCVKWNLLNKANHSTVKRNISNDKIATASNFNYLFLLGLLNSNLINWYFLNFLSESLHFYPDDAKELPVRKLNTDEQEPFIKLVDQILKLKSQNKDTTKLENQIDVMVYKLYELTYDEVKIVDPEFWMSEGEYEKVEIK